MSVESNVLAGRQATRSALEEALARGIAVVQVGDKATAHSIFKQAVGQYPDEAELWVWLGGTSSDLDQAEEAFKNAHLLEPANEDANLGLRWVDLRRRANMWTGAAVAAPVAAAAATTPAPSEEVTPTTQGIDDPVRVAAIADANKHPERRLGTVTLFGDFEMSMFAAVLLLVILVVLITALVYFGFLT